MFSHALVSADRDLNMGETGVAAQIGSLLSRLSGAECADDITALLELDPGRYVHFQMDADRYIERPLPSTMDAFDRLKESESRLRWEVAKHLFKYFALEWNLGDHFDLCKFHESISLHSVFLRADLSWELYYDDGDIMGGQIAVAETDSEGSLNRIYLAA
jgi:hypothetical protein